MKLNCKRIDFTYTPGEEIFNFPEESGLPFIFDVEEELTGDPAVMDAVGEMLDEAEKLAEKAKAAIKAALADEDSRYHSVVTFFMEFHRDDVGPDTTTCSAIFWKKTPKPTPNIRGTAATGSTGQCRARTATCPSLPPAGGMVTILSTSGMTPRAKSAPCMCGSSTLKPVIESRIKNVTEQRRTL